MTATKRKKTGGSADGYIRHDEGLRPPNGLYLWTLTEDGEWRVDVPTYEDLIKHAEKFGTSQVPETAVRLGFDLERLTALITRLDVIDVRRRDKDHHTIKRGSVSNRSPEVRAKKLLNWVPPEEEDGTGTPAAG